MNRIVTIIYVNNEQKQFTDKIRKNNLKDFKCRQTKRFKAELKVINSK